MENPEFRRHVWLELTPHRLVAMPVILGLGFGFILAVLRAAESESSQPLATAAIWTLGALLLLWGTRLAADAVTEEVRGHTWDQQRMCALPPWQMAWGKLLGGPVFPWYGAAICAVVFLAAAETPPIQRLAELLMVVGVATLVHAAAVILALLAVRRGADLPARSGAAFPLMAIFVAFPVLQTSLAPDARTTELIWYGVSTSVFHMSLASVVLYAGWAVVGVHRLMRAELQVRGTPALWLTFLVSSMVWAAGFIPRELGAGDAAGSITPTRLLVAYVIAHAAVYVTAFTERKDASVFRRLLWFRRERQRERLLDEFPLWLVSVPVAGLAALAILVQPEASASTTQKQLVAGLALLGTRDLGLLMALKFGSRRGDVAGLVYLGVLYALAPALARALEWETAAGFFWPRLDVGPVASLTPLAVQALFFVALARARWTRQIAAQPEPPIRSN
jgi:hypothetical protein